MPDSSTIAPLTTLVTFGFAALIIGGLVFYLALVSGKEKRD